MSEREIYLMELALEGELSLEEEKEFKELLAKNSQLINDFKEQQKVKEVLMNMSLKNPGKEFWDGYWLSIYNRIERGIAWILISISHQRCRGNKYSLTACYKGICSRWAKLIKCRADCLKQADGYNQAFSRPVYTFSL